MKYVQTNKAVSDMQKKGQTYTVTGGVFIMPFALSTGTGKLKKIKGR